MFIPARFAALMVLLACVADLRLAAQELTGMGGVMGTGEPHGTSYAWQLDYRYHLGDRFAWSASWINEGHTASHHRDGLALQAWGLVFNDPDDFSLAIGAGGYHYADTHFLPGDGYTNDHGWTPIFSVSATYYTDSPWLFRLTANHINRASGLQTNSLVAGVGYHIGWKRDHNPHHAARVRAAHALTVLYGRTIVNSRSSEHAAAAILEYRHALARHVDWTLSLVNEGDPEIMHRHGAATQIWLVDAYRERRIGVGLGVGPYFIFQREGPPNGDAKLEPGTAVMLSPTASYRLASHWQARLTWNRVLSKDNRDADVIVLGIGYRWGTK